MSKHAVWEDLVSVGRRHRRETAKTRKGTERQPKPPTDRLIKPLLWVAWTLGFGHPQKWRTKWTRSLTSLGDA
jgi:hypothetical protein